MSTALAFLSSAASAASNAIFFDSVVGVALVPGDLNLLTLRVGRGRGRVFVDLPLVLPVAGIASLFAHSTLKPEHTQPC